MGQKAVRSTILEGNKAQMISLEKKQVILTGLMGSGKSAVGGLLAAEMGRRLVDTDRVVESIAGMPVSQIFAEKGEELFRELETRALEQIFAEAAPGSLVVATGGGAVIRAKNRSLLKKEGLVIFFEAAPEELVKRLAEDKTRPLLAGKGKLETLKTLMAEREQYYQDCHFRIDTTGQRPEAVAAAIIRLLQRKK